MGHQKAHRSSNSPIGTCLCSYGVADVPETMKISNYSVFGGEKIESRVLKSASVPRSYMRDEGRSLEAGLQEQASNPLKLLW